MTPEVYAQVKAVMDRYGIPEYIWYPIAVMESGGNPYAENITSREHSVGIFQINLVAHPEYASYDLKDPAVNAEIAARDFISWAWEQAKELFSSPEDQAAYVWRYGIRPQWTAEKEAAIKEEVRKFLSGAGQIPIWEGQSIASDTRSSLRKWWDDLVYSVKKKLGLIPPEWKQELEAREQVIQKAEEKGIPVTPEFRRNTEILRSWASYQEQERRAWVEGLTGVITSWAQNMLAKTMMILVGLVIAAIGLFILIRPEQYIPAVRMAKGAVKGGGD